LLDVRIDGGRITEAGVIGNVAVALRYLDAWLQGVGAAGIFNLMEDAATAEIARAQLWQWRVHHARLDDGQTFDAEVYQRIRSEQVAAIEREASGESRVHDAARLLDSLVLSDDFTPFLTIPGYEHLP
jgi:malate synthase